ncbi:MAG TPA: small multidrug resistance protein [Stenomitos sp.]
MPNGVWMALCIGLTVGLNALGQVLLKLGAQRSPFNLYLLGGLTMYGCSTVIYILLLSRLNLSFVYPLVLGLTLCATLGASVLWLRESVAVGQWIGIGLMLSGLAAIALSHSTR